MAQPPKVTRRIHHRRFTETLATYVLSRAEQELKAGTLYKQLNTALEQAGDKFRSLIDKNAPLFYVIDFDVIAQIITEELQQGVRKVTQKLRDYETTYEVGGKATKVFKELIVPGMDQTIFSDDPLFYEKFTSQVLTNDFQEVLAKKMYLEVSESIGASRNISDSYTKNIKKVFDEYVNELTTAAINLTTSTYYLLPRISIKYTQKIKTLIFNSDRIFIASDGKILVPSLGANSLVIVADSFEYGKKKINEALQSAAKEVLEARGVFSNEYDPKNPLASFKIGNFIDIGHTAAFLSNGTPIGVNMPAAQEVYVQLPSEKANALEASLSGIYADLNLQVSLNQNYTSLGGDLLGIGVAFGVVMRKSVNSTLIRTVENRIIAAYKTQLEKNVSEVLKSKEVRVSLEQVSTFINRSPTLPEYLQELLLHTVDPNSKGPSPKIKKAAVENIANNLNVAKGIKSKQTVKVSRTKSKPTGSKKLSIKTSKFKTQIQTSTISNLDRLLVLINANLVERIKQNMGDGNRRDVLNLRTGRLAESVNIERLSESRQGMIMAFYSYMKNPYATFSDGGAQSSPRSRDPKLLISKSIREIAQQQVANRLRAVAL